MPTRLEEHKSYNNLAAANKSNLDYIALSLSLNFRNSMNIPGILLRLNFRTFQRRYLPNLATNLPVCTFLGEHVFHILVGACL